MECNCQQGVTRSFRLICVAGAIVASVWCLYVFVLDEDISLVSFKEFNDEDDGLYPSVTLCFAFPFLEEKLKNYGDHITGTLYQKFLKGEYWDEKMLLIDYDSVTINFEEYVKHISIFEETWVGKAFVSFRGALQKCFTVDSPSPSEFPLKKNKILYLQIQLRTAIFPNETRPSGSTGRVTNDLFGIQLHYPGQRMRPIIQNWRWKKHEAGGEPEKFVMRYTFWSMEVLKKRNKRSQPCNIDWKGTGSVTK